ncbi:MAG: hypothetical protein K8R38_08110 [Verrucomicrobia bacterium]|nr:hypothetical protein [Verrucomicrobiota bacterium]
MQRIFCIALPMAIAGAAVTISFSCLFAAQNFSTHAVMILLLSDFIGLTFYTIITLDFPFSGFVAISPDPFVRLEMM